MLLAEMEYFKLQPAAAIKLVRLPTQQMKSVMMETPLTVMDARVHVYQYPLVSHVLQIQLL